MAEHVARPIVISVLALVAVTFAAYITGSIVTNVSAGVELTAKSIGLPILLWFLAIVLAALATIGWAQRRRYVRSTTPEERAVARTTKSPSAHRPGDDLDYGTRLEDSP